MQVLGFGTAFYILGSYFWSEHTHNYRPYTWANALGAVILLPINIYLGVYFGAFLNLAFGLIATYGLWRHRKT